MKDCQIYPALPSMSHFLRQNIQAMLPSMKMQLCLIHNAVMHDFLGDALVYETQWSWSVFSILCGEQNAI